MNCSRSRSRSGSTAVLRSLFGCVWAGTVARGLLHRICPLLALSGHTEMSAVCPLSGVKRTEPKRDAMSAVDPKRTLRGLKSRSAAVGSVVSSLHCMNDPQPEGHMASYIGRRKFLATLGGAAAWPLAAVKLPRRQFLHLAAGAVALPAASRIAWAQAYPARPVRLIVAVAPGGGADILARLMGHWLSERLGQQLIIDNRP